jgi:cytochrome c oxidase cbb3-type subunit I/II
MDDPRATSPGSIMPRYSWLLNQKLDTNSIPPRISALRKVGVPYPPGFEQTAVAEANKQAKQIVANLKQGSVEAQPDKEIIALIAYLQRLGTDIKAAPAPPVSQPAPIGNKAPPTNTTAKADASVNPARN